MDALSEVLRMIRLQGALFLHASFHEPWCVQAPCGADMAPSLCPGAQQLAILHLVLEGSCWVNLQEVEAPLPVHRGDVVVLPVGDAHLIGSGRGHKPLDPRDVLSVKVPELTHTRYGGDGDACLLACGWFAFERDVPNPLLAALPRVFRVSLAGRPAGPWLQESIRYAVREAASGQPGSTAIAARVAESLFLESLRAYLDGLPPQETGWLAGMRDVQVGRCLLAMHAQPARAWSLEELAREAHTSRSVLAERFAEVMGVPPMQYLKRWRLSVAARLLCNERSNLLRVAEAVGYESEASFSRAFKAEYGVAPGAWRARGHSAAP